VSLPIVNEKNLALQANEIVATEAAAIDGYSFGAWNLVLP
jgi:hypothetical protein